MKKVIAGVGFMITGALMMLASLVAAAVCSAPLTSWTTSYIAQPETVYNEVDGVYEILDAGMESEAGAKLMTALTDTGLAWLLAIAIILLAAGCIVTLLGMRRTKRKAALPDEGPDTGTAG